jgi:uroporphyrin-III C-methyltransferase/precorrin-2 dehydrogenase/sirohydrochlorin ferrochelatase/uroporphyrin-III C-methyltransferase
VRFVTYYKSDVVTDEYWKELANTTDTIVFYMSAETLGSVVKNLLLHGIANDRKLAVIGQATTPEQKISIYDLKDFEEQDYISPTIAIIGRVVELSERFSWLTNNEKPQEYFKPSATRITPHEKTFKI